MATNEPGVFIQMQNNVDLASNPLSTKEYSNSNLEVSSNTSIVLSSLCDPVIRNEYNEGLPSVILSGLIKSLNLTMDITENRIQSRR
jgi:hypothetical protein